MLEQRGGELLLIYGGTDSRIQTASQSSPGKSLRFLVPTQNSSLALATAAFLRIRKLLNTTSFVGQWMSILLSLRKDSDLRRVSGKRLGVGAVAKKEKALFGF